MMVRIQNLIFIVLFLSIMGLLGWLTERHSVQLDLTWGNRNSLTEASVNALKELDQPITITAFVRDSSKVVHDITKDLVERYQRHKPDIELSFLNPDLVPQLVREHGITVDGEVGINEVDTRVYLSDSFLILLCVPLFNDTCHGVIAAPDNS
ncbi:MAG: GldG family protein, partial [Gammaproteobacteria bacterium]|nr:GldG family protein [Gammaproteobacteria bacterium]